MLHWARIIGLVIIVVFSVISIYNSKYYQAYCLPGAASAVKIYGCKKTGL